jgi:uncharacterized protein (TIGR03437 family)
MTAKSWKTSQPLYRRRAALLMLAGLSLACAGLDAQAILGRNLIVNGDAEAGPSDPDGHHPISSFPGWTAQGTPDVVQYASGYNIGPDDIVPLKDGSSYFTGGRTQADSSLSQNIDMSSAAATIDAGTATFVASAYLGGFQSEPETAQMIVTFLSSSGGTLGSTTLGPVTSDDRKDRTGLWYRRTIGRVPVGTRSAGVVLTMPWQASSTNDGAADNLSLIVNAPSAPQSLLGTNLIVNGNAETPAVADPTIINDNAVDVPGWSRTGLFSIDSYTASDADLDDSAPGPDDRGSFYFFGGPGNALSSAFQDIDVSSAAALIDAGNVTYALSTWIGGYDGQNDNCVLGLQFQDWSGNVLGSTTLGPVSEADRNGVTELLPFSQGAGVPVGTRVINISMTMTRTDGSDNDGLADSLSLVLSAPGTTPGNPVITGIVNDASFTAGGPISPGAWIAIFGTGLAPAGDSRLWNPATEIVNGKLPLSLDGTSVTVNGKPASVEFISPTQVNIQPPDDTSAGPVQVVLSASGSSSSFTVNYAVYGPGLFGSTAPYIVAQHADNSYVTPASPAKPGEVIILWGTGFGPATPAVPSGQVFLGANPLANTPTVIIGGQPAAVDFAGVVGAGLVQINVHVPASLNNGDAAVVATIQSVSTQSTANLIPVHN